MADPILTPLAAPPYDRRQLVPGIVHLGLGGFHRAHMARYLHDLMVEDPAVLRWGIVAAGLRPADRPLVEALDRQDGLYTLIERDGAGERRTVIGSIARVIDASGSTAELIRTASDPAVRILSLTVTEHGYCLDRATKRLDLAHPDIVHDLANPDAPRSAIGVIAAVLARRRRSGAGGLTLLSCDNIQHNGRVLADALGRFAERIDGDLARWIAEAVDCPGSMVDRITPRPTDAATQAFRASAGVDDAAPLVAEPFRQWVIEDRFRAGRPPLERVGVQMVADVAPYERMKLRLLNASHLALAGPGELMGLTGIAETIADLRVQRFVTLLMDRETGPTVGSVEGVDIDAYKRSVLDRFANPAIPDTVARVNADAPLNYLLDPLRDRLAEGQPIPLLALALAAWLRRVRGEDDAGRPLAIVHPLAAELRARAVAGGADPAPLLALEPLFGDLGRDPRLGEAVAPWLRSLYERGAATTLEQAVGDG